MGMSDEMVSRRNVVLGVSAAGAGLVAVATLAACSPSPAPSNGAGGQEASTTVPESSVPVAGGVVIDAAQVIVTQPTAGQYKAFSAICTHAGCLVAGVSQGQIVCPCHGSTFNMTTGAVINGPASAPLPTRTVTVNGKDLVIS